MKVITIEQLYDFSVSNNKALLTTMCNDQFWLDYKNNQKMYDALFCRLYSSFWYFRQKENDTIEQLLNKFNDDVMSHLLVNKKKYNQLYLIHTVNFASNSITDNYYITESLERSTTKNENITSGERADTTSENIGEHTNTTNDTFGNQENTTTVKTSSYDSEDFYNKEKNDNTVGARTDTSTTTNGSQSNTISFSKGQEVDSVVGDGSEQYTLTRRGNIGVKTSSAILKEHEDYWDAYKFYTKIFADISAELLLVN